MMIRSMPPASAHLAERPVPAPPPMMGRPAATWERSRARIWSRVMARAPGARTVRHPEGRPRVTLSAPGPSVPPAPATMTPDAHSPRKENVMKIGARNRLEGEVIEVKRGAVMGQVRVRIAGGAEMESVMTLDSLDEMGLKVGDKVRVAVKAVNVLLIKE